MSVWGISLVRDEADVIEGTIRHMASEVDQLLVMDNRSVDGTRDILDRLAQELPLTVVDDDGDGFYQSVKMTALAERAYTDGAVWIVPFDGDELWWAEDARIADVLMERGPAETVCFADWDTHVCTADDVDDPDPFRSMVWRRPDVEPARKLAVRWAKRAVIDEGNHIVDHPFGVTGETLLNICHFPVRSKSQLLRKTLRGAHAYDDPSLPAGWGTHWRSRGRLVEKFGPDVIGQIFDRYHFELSPIDAGMVREVPPYLRWEKTVSDDDEPEVLVMVKRVFGDPCLVCGKDGWPEGSAGNARRIHELAEHDGDPRVEPRWADS